MVRKGNGTCVFSFLGIPVYHTGFPSFSDVAVPQNLKNHLFFAKNCGNRYQYLVDKGT